MYTATDVPDLHEWTVKHLDLHPLFERVADDDLKDDPCVKFIMESTEESAKVARESRDADKQYAVYRRIADPLELQSP